MVPGVADIVSFGGFIKTVRGEPEPRADEVLRTSRCSRSSPRWAAATPTPAAAKVEQGDQQYLIRGIGLLRSADDIGNIVVAERNGTPVLIRDIADGHGRRGAAQGIVGQDDEDEIVDRHRAHAQRREPFAKCSPRVKARIDLLNSSILPKGVKLVPFYDRTWLIDTTLHTVFKNLLEGALLVTFVLLLFLGNLRAAAIVAVIIPLSLLATFIGLHDARHSGQPAVAGRHGLRHHRRRRGDRGGEHLPPLSGQLKHMSDQQTHRPRHHREADGGSGPAHVLLDADHHRRAYADLHAAAPRRPHLRADGLHRRLAR